MHGLEELESKLSAYHVMVDKEVLHKREGRGSLSPIDQAPPPPLEKPKWKMSMSAVKDTLVDARPFTDTACLSCLRMTG